MSAVLSASLSFRDYVLGIWLPNHVVEISTRQAYTYQLNRHLIPWFSDIRIDEISTLGVREWVAHCTAAGVSRANLKHLRQILSVVLSTAVQDSLIERNPCAGVRTPTAPYRRLRVLTPEQYECLHAALPPGQMTLLVDMAIATGLRWGELTELRVDDIDVANRVLEIERAVVEISPDFRQFGQRFLVKPVPKSRHARRVKIGSSLAAHLLDHIGHEGLCGQDLLFQMFRTRTLDPVVPGELTLPNERGRRYQHGTTTAYTAGRCRCCACREAIAAYQRQRRAGLGLRGGKRGLPESDSHIPRDWFRYHIWLPARKTARLVNVRFHDLRHAHASWLLAGGASLQVVRERLGHASIATTERYH